MLRFLCILCGALLLSGCASRLAPTPTPPAAVEGSVGGVPVKAEPTLVPTPTFSAVVEPTPSATVEPTFPATAEPTLAPTPTPPAAVEDVLIRAVQENLAAYPRPEPFQGGNIPAQKETEQWDYYRQGLAASLSSLFSDARSRSLSTQSLVAIFAQGSGLSLAAYASPTDFALVVIQDANPEVRIGGGASPNTPSDAIYILNRHGDVWPLGLVGGVVDASWGEGSFVVLVARTIWGGGVDYEVWHVPQGSWKPETKLAFGQSYSLPEPQLSSDGQLVTAYSYDMAADSQALVASIYAWQDGQYLSKERRIIGTVTPSPHQ